MQRFSAASLIAALFTALFLSFLTACGGTSSSANTVASLVISPTVLSMNQGQVVGITASAQNATGSTVAADINFSSSNTALANVSSGGLLCAGAWDANIITCTPRLGPSGVGTVTITASAATNSAITATLTLYVHEQVDQVNMTAPASCTSLGQTANVSALVLSTTAPGCSVAAPCNITSTVGPITYGSTDTSIVSISASGVLTAAKPGQASVFAGVSGVNSVAQPTQTCPVSYILLHNSTDYTDNFTLAPAATQTVAADVYDTKGAYIKPSLTWASNYPASATAAVASTGSPSGIITAVVPGTTTVTATCSNPDCNANLPAQYSINQLTVTVPGSHDTTVYAASTNSTTLVPITTSNNTAGTAITLPYAPNSILADPTGAHVYLGSATTLMQVTVATNSVATVGVPGSVIAVSPDGNYVVMSDPTSGGTYIYDVTTSSFVSRTFFANASSAAFTPDSKTTWYTYQNQAYVSSLSAAVVQYTLPYTTGSIAFNANGALGYITSSTAHQVDVRSTCDHSEIQPLAANAPTLISTLPTGNGAIVADSPNVDVINSGGLVGAGCPTTATSSLASFNMGVGPFTASQMFVSPNNGNAWIISNLPELLGFNLVNSTPFAIPLANGATPLSGGARIDSQQLYLGASDGTVHRIDVASLTDAAQIAVNIKNSSGTLVGPNLVAVVP